MHITANLARDSQGRIQAQVNPHFLYNTLETMSSIAITQKCHTVSTLCQAMANIFRYSIDMQDPLSTVASEIVHLKNYLYVMNVRTRNEIELEIDIDQDLLGERVPRLSLQPLVENAISHGLVEKRGSKKIAIDGIARDGDLVLSICDNGVGMDAEAINRQLREENADTFGRSTSIGLANINARIKLLFGRCVRRFRAKSAERRQHGDAAGAPRPTGSRVDMSAACKVLIVDDEFWVRENLRSMLASENLPLLLLEPAETGEDALRIMENERPTSSSPTSPCLSSTATG